MLNVHSENHGRVRTTSNSFFQVKRHTSVVLDSLDDKLIQSNNPVKLKFKKNIEEVLEEKETECELKVKKLVDEHLIESERLRSRIKDLEEEKDQLETKLDRLKSLRSSDKLKKGKFVKESSNTDDDKIETSIIDLRKPSQNLSQTQCISISNESSMRPTPSLPAIPEAAPAPTAPPPPPPLPGPLTLISYP